MSNPDMAMYISITLVVLNMILAVLVFYFAAKMYKILNKSRLFKYGHQYTSAALFFYDSKQNLIESNNVAHQLLWRDNISKKEIQDVESFTKLLNYHHLPETDGVSLEVYKNMHLGNSEDIFSGLVRFDETIYLAQICKTGGSGYIALLKNAESLHTDDFSHEDMSFKNYILDQALKATSAGVVVVDARSGRQTILHVNQRFADLVRTNLDELIHMSLEDLLQRYSLDETIETALLYAAANLQPQSVEIPLNYGGQHLWYGLQIVPTIDYNNKPELFIGILEDKTESKLHEARVQQSQKLESLGQLAGGVAHDFNNIMSIIDGYARILKKEVELSNASQDHLDRIMQSVQRGAGLTRQLLTFGRHNIVVDGVIDLGKIIKDQEMLIKPLIDASINLEIDVQHNLMVECSQDTVGQILINMVINARDAMPNGGTLKISVKGSEENDMVCLCISDTGCGMADDIKGKIFDPFFTTKGQGKGTGLGLSMIYGLVKEMGGHIDVETALKEGTTFSIYIPLSHKLPVKKLNDLTQRDGDIDLTGYTILVAEDEPDLLTIVSGMLEEKGATVLTASNGNEALMVQDEYTDTIDLLLTDVVMPQLDGVRLAALFEEIRPETKIIFMSGYPANATMKKIELPADARLISKPIKYENLMALLKAILSESPELIEAAIKEGSGSWQETTIH